MAPTPKPSRPILQLRRLARPGQGLFRGRRPRESAADFDQALTVQPGDAQSYAARAEFFAATSQPERAAQTSHRHQSEARTHRDLQRTRLRYVAFREYQKAIEDFTQAIKLRLDNPELTKAGHRQGGDRQVPRRSGRFQPLAELQAGLRGRLGERALAYAGLGDYQHSFENLSSRSR